MLFFFVFKESNILYENLQVMSTLTTTLPVETVTETQTEEITVTETTTLVTTAPPETLVLVSTEFTPQMMSNTETVVSTLVETSMITETSTFIFTEILPPIISTATIIETVTVDDIAFTQMGMEVCNTFSLHMYIHMFLKKLTELNMF